MPVAAALVRVTAEDTHTSRSNTADADGHYAVALPDGEGPFSLRAERIGYVTLTVTLPADAAAGWHDLRLSPRLLEIPGLVARGARSDRQDAPIRSPGGNEQNTASWSTPVVPLDLGDLGSLASLEPGVHVLDDGSGLSFFAQDPSQNRVTLDGATFGATRLPQEALSSATVVTSAYDISRGQYSGGLIEASTLSGTNLFGGALRTRFSDPRLQWQPASGSGRWEESTSFRVESGLGGALVWNRLFWYAAFSASRSSKPLVSLENAGPAILQSFGVHSDSVARLEALLRDAGVGSASGLPLREATTQLGSALVRLDYDVSERLSFMLRLDGRGLEAEGLGIDPRATLGSGGAARDAGGGVLAQITSRSSRVENELRAYRAEESSRLDPAWAGPAGTVRVQSELDDGSVGTSVLRFGGGSLKSESGSALLEIADEARVVIPGGHEIKMGGVLNESSADLTAAYNLRGSFAFNSLGDLRAGRPALFTRTLGEQTGEARARYAALYVGDTWNGERLAVTYGARLEARSYPRRGETGPPIDHPFGLQGGGVPSEWGASPRFGWTFDGARVDLRGGAGLFRGTVPLPALAAALGSSQSTGSVVLTCVGPAAPSPTWNGSGDDPEAIPAECAGGAPAFASRAPQMTVFADDFAAPRTWHASAGGTLQTTRRSRLALDVSVVRGTSQPVATDRNLDATPSFQLRDEGARPVYVPRLAIDPGTGGVSPEASRLYPSLGTVREISGRGTSTVAQATGTLNSYHPRYGVLVYGAYTFTLARDGAGALAALGGPSPVAVDPTRLVVAASDRERRHDFQLRVTVGPRPWVRVGFLGRLTSGIPFTPMVDGDVNGDGGWNDPAFIFDPKAAGGTSLAEGMTTLLTGAPREIRECLAGQLGRIARRNSCHTGWTSSLDVQADFQPWRRALSRRFLVSVATSNGLVLADRLLHGAEGRRGWGEPAFADRTLLRVRGFDAARDAFLYEVNPGFGTRVGDRRRPGLPFSLTVQGRLAVGADPTYQPLQRLINQTMGPGRSPEELRYALAERIPNLPAQVAGLDSALSLGLTPQQRERLRRDAQVLGALLAPISDSLAVIVSDVENARRKNDRGVWEEIGALTRQISGALDDEIRSLREILTPEQWTRLPQEVRAPDRQFIPPRRPGRPVQIR